MTEGTKDFYLANFARLGREMDEDGQVWTQSLRNAAIKRFATLGFPTTRLEEWKYTNVTPITKIPFQQAKRLVHGLAAEALAAATIPGLASTQLVYINGHFTPKLSTLQALPEGVQVGSLAQALGTR